MQCDLNTFREQEEEGSMIDRSLHFFRKQLILSFLPWIWIWCDTLNFILIKIFKLKLPKQEGNGPKDQRAKRAIN